MKKLRIFPSHLEIRRADIPANSELQMVKLSYEEAMAFDSDTSCTFGDLLAKYGVANQLKEGEFYSGYAAAFFWWGHAEVVQMEGYLQKIDPKYAGVVWDYSLSELIRKGCAWECLYPLGLGNTTVGCYNYVYTFHGCTFANSIRRAQEMFHLYEDVDAEVFDKTLKDKLVEALLSNEHEVELTDTENEVLYKYLGRVYYDMFFVELLPDPPELIVL